MSQFNYLSVQSHTVKTPEKEEEHLKEVRVENGKGTKTLVVKKNGKTRKTTEKLSKAEIKNIKAHKFMPHLFRKCSARLNGGGGKTHKKKRSTA